jgi:transposase InsO family protein
MEGKVLNGINQAWQSDMFYLKVEGKAYYGVTIIDVYSRKLLALHVSKSLAAQQLGIAMRKALRARTGHNLRGCIFHSDRGSQYISTIHKTLVAKNDMQISMCLLPQENAYAERVQGILKDGYLEPFDLTENNLRYMVPRIIRYYNQERPHENLNNISPDAFENQISKLAHKSRPEMPIYQWDHEKLTKSQVINKKKKEAKKKKSTQIIPILEN